MKISLSFAALTIFCATAVSQPAATISLQNPPAMVTLFGEDLFSTALNERDFALSPDGTEIYYTISTPRSTFQTIVVSKKESDGKWSQPEVASFAGSFSDLEPVFSHDGNTLYFASNRPLTGSTPKDFDIWKVSRVGKSWGEPVNLGNLINTASDEFYPSIAKNGNLYFTATYDYGVGREDIYVSKLIQGVYQKPEPLDTAVNTKYYEFNAFVSPDERFIIFTSYGRKDDTGGGDLYMCVKDAGGKWGKAVNLKALNSKQLDYCPWVSHDGRILFFTSDRHELPVSFTEAKATVQKIKDITGQAKNSNGNIYWIDFQEVMRTYKP